MNSVSVDNLSLVLIFGLVLLAMGISQKEKLGLTKDILVAVIPYDCSAIRCWLYFKIYFSSFQCFPQFGYGVDYSL